MNARQMFVLFGSIVIVLSQIDFDSVHAQGTIPTATPVVAHTLPLAPTATPTATATNMPPTPTTIVWPTPMDPKLYVPQIEKIISTSTPTATATPTLAPPTSTPTITPTFTATAIPTSTPVFYGTDVALGILRGIDYPYEYNYENFDIGASSYSQVQEWYERTWMLLDGSSVKYVTSVNIGVSNSAQDAIDANVEWVRRNPNMSFVSPGVIFGCSYLSVDGTAYHACASGVTYENLVIRVVTSVAVQTDYDSDQITHDTRDAAMSIPVGSASFNNTSMSNANSYFSNLTEPNLH